MFLIPSRFRLFIVLAAISLKPISGFGAEIGEFELAFTAPLTENQRSALQAYILENRPAQFAYLQLKDKALPLMHAEPEPLATIEYEGMVNTEPKRIASVEKLQKINVPAILLNYWQVNGDEDAAAACRRFVLAWSKTYHPTGNDVNENKLFPLFCIYADMRSTFSRDEQASIDRWLESIGELHAKAAKQERHMNNRFTKRLRILEVLGRALQREEWQTLASKGLQRFVTHSLYPDGSSLDLKQRDTLTYHASALKPLLDLCIYKGSEGAEWYYWESQRGASIAKSVDYVVPYARGEKVHEEWIHSKVELDLKRAEAGLQEYQPGRLYEPTQAYELLLKASCFDPSLAPLALQLSPAPDERFPDWSSVVLTALSQAK